MLAALSVGAAAAANDDLPSTSDTSVREVSDEAPGLEASSKAQGPKARGKAKRPKAIGRAMLHEGMVWIAPGKFWMGCDDDSFPDAKPLHEVSLKGFWIDITPVTNESFARFVRATGYKTVAEQTPKAEDFPGAPPENLVPGSLVFVPPPLAVSKRSHYAWWRYVPGANWQHPEGPGSDITGKEKHPVVQVAWADAVAYAKWAGKRLPTEAEFEYAARGGGDRKRFAWGDQFKPDGKWQANIWQGVFPTSNTVEDGFATTSPVATFPANGFGLYDMAGNVWQWCADWYRADYYKMLAAASVAAPAVADGTPAAASVAVGAVIQNPSGPADSFDPRERGVAKRVQRGGSFLCTDQYCARYLVGARGRGEPSSGSSNVGFRCASD